MNKIVMSYVLRRDFEIQQRLGISAHYLEQRAQSHFKDPDEAERKIEYIKEYLIETDKDPWEILIDFNESMPEQHILRLPGFNSEEVDDFRGGDPVLGFTPGFFRRVRIPNTYDFDATLRPMFEHYCQSKNGVIYNK